MCCLFKEGFNMDYKHNFFLINVSSVSIKTIRQMLKLVEQWCWKHSLVFHAPFMVGLKKEVDNKFYIFRCISISWLGVWKSVSL